VIQKQGIVSILFFRIKKIILLLFDWIHQTFHLKLFDKSYECNFFLAYLGVII